MENRERRTERAGAKRQTFHGHRERSARQARDGRGAGRTVEGLPCGADTKEHEEPRRHTKDCQEDPQDWKFGSLEVWRLGGATEVEARTAAFGGDETERCAADTKRTKNHEDTRRTDRGNRRLRRLEPIRGRLPQADCQCVLDHGRFHRNSEKRKGWAR